MSGSSNRFAHLADQEPVVEDGIDYWESQPASLDGVLGALFFSQIFRECSISKELKADLGLVWVTSLQFTGSLLLEFTRICEVSPTN